jgi:hypothetical protein
MGITNNGRLLRFNSSSAKTNPLTERLPDGQVVTSATYVGSSNIEVLIGCTSGNVYAINTSNEIKPFFDASSRPSLMKVTSLAAGNFGKNSIWIAAGYQNNYLILWKLGTDDKRPIYIVPISTRPPSYYYSFRVINPDFISSLGFMPQTNMLIAATNHGYLYKIPLSMSTLASKIKSESH